MAIVVTRGGTSRTRIQELKVVFSDGQLVLRYFDTELPINPRQAPRVYRLAVDGLTESLGSDSPHLHEFLSILSSLENMPPYTESDPARAAALRDAPDRVPADPRHDAARPGPRRSECGRSAGFAPSRILAAK